jgi:hypothetical protein
MKLYNKGGRIFHFGDNHDDCIKPSTFKEVPDDKADALLKDYPHELVAAEDHRKNLAANAGALAAKEAALNKEKAESAVKDAHIKKLEQQLAAMQKLVAQPDSPFPPSVDTGKIPKRK